MIAAWLLYELDGLILLGLLFLFQLLLLQLSFEFLDILLVIAIPPLFTSLATSKSPGVPVLIGPALLHINHDVELIYFPVVTP